MIVLVSSSENRFLSFSTSASSPPLQYSIIRYIFCKKQTCIYHVLLLTIVNSIVASIKNRTHNLNGLKLSYNFYIKRHMFRFTSNEEVFNRANTKPTLLDELLKRRLAFHGHLVRKGGITLDLMIGRLHGTRPRGRPRTTWLKDLATQANISCKEAITIPRDRKKWRSVGNPRRTPDE